MRPFSVLTTIAFVVQTRPMAAAAASELSFAHDGYKRSTPRVASGRKIRQRSILEVILLSSSGNTPPGAPPTRRSRRMRSLRSALGSATTSIDAEAIQMIPGGVRILPAGRPLRSFYTDDPERDDDDGPRSDDAFSILSWNILHPNSGEHCWNHKMYAPHVPMEERTWSHRQDLIKERLLLADADIVCVQEADGDTFGEDFSFMEDAGYGHCLHKKFRFRCATFYKGDQFVLEQEAHKDRTLVTVLRSIKGGDSDRHRLLNVVNCHLSGGAAPERRLRQLHEALDQFRKWKDKAALTLARQKKAKRPSPRNILKAEESLERYENSGAIVCGDFNSDGNTAVRTLLVEEGGVDPDWREPQYPNVPLTSKRRGIIPSVFDRPFADAAELAYAANVCDGDYGCCSGGRPPTYVVPNLAPLLLMPVEGEGQAVRTQFGPQVARGLADTLGLSAFCKMEIDRAFEAIDLDGNDLIDEDEVQKLLESVYVAAYGPQIEAERNKFFNGFQDGKGTAVSMSREQLTKKLMVLQEELEGRGSKGGRLKRAEFDPQVAKSLADTLGLRAFCEKEFDRAFESIDVDGNNSIDEDEVQNLLESVYVATYGREIEEEKRKFFSDFQQDSTRTNFTKTKTGSSMSREQLAEKLMALQQELEGGTEGAELVEVRTEADARRMIDRFTPLLRDALDHVFDIFSSDGGETLTEEQVAEFLVKANGQLGKGSMSRQADAIFKRKAATSDDDDSTDRAAIFLTRQDWYGIFARELGEGTWWQVVHDLESCGAKLHPSRQSLVGEDQHQKQYQHYEGWLDYIYFNLRQLTCTGVQEALSDVELSRIYNEGDTLPNGWHPSDHLPVAALFRWRSL